MAQRIYRLYCEYCNWIKITDGSNVRLIEFQTSPIPGGMPKKDPISDELILPKSQKQTKRFKCPACGRLVIPKQIKDPQGEIDDKIELEKRIKERTDNEKLMTEKQRIKYENWINGNQEGSS